MSFYVKTENNDYKLVRNIIYNNNIVFKSRYQSSPCWAKPFTLTITLENCSVTEPTINRTAIYDTDYDAYLNSGYWDLEALEYPILFSETYEISADDLVVTHSYVTDNISHTIRCKDITTILPPRANGVTGRTYSVYNPNEFTVVLHGYYQGSGISNGTITQKTMAAKTATSFTVLGTPISVVVYFTTEDGSIESKKTQLAGY